MPELPEVETVRRQLSPTLVGRKITVVECGPPSYFFVTPPRRLKQVLVGKKVTALDRIGKALIAQMNDESRLLLHLGMTGQLVARHLEQDGHRHMRLELGSNKRIVSFRDVRKFGKVEWIPPGESSKRLDKLGPDALTVESDHLWERTRKRKLNIKSTLLNQEILAGVGNIYADEALFASGIRPTKSAGRLNRKQIDRLTAEVRDVLERAVQGGGSTINDYMKPDGELGGFQDWHQVYGKTGEPCAKCGSSIERKVLGGRSTHFCRRCQT